MKRTDLPRGVFLKSGRYYLVVADGEKRIWTKLTKAKEGLPAMLMALANLKKPETDDDRIPQLVDDWLRDESSQHSKKQQANDAYRMKEIKARFADFRAAQVSPPAIMAFLKPWRSKPRSHNAYRADLRELMRYAEERGFRLPGSNPVDSINPVPIKKRTRYLTDSEVRRIKFAAMKAKERDGKRQDTRIGPMLCALIDMAYLTGQRIGDLLQLRWKKDGEESSYITQHGISFAPAKIASSTGVRVLIQWTPKLTALVAKLKAMKTRNMLYVFCTQEGQQYTYYGASSAWMRAVKRSGVADCHFHDLRAKALTDKDEKEGIRGAQTMGAHSTEAQTADYVHHKKAKKTGATR